MNVQWVTWASWAGLLFTPVMISVGQVLFKATAERSKDASSFAKVLFDPYLMSAVCLYGVATILWVWVLRHFPLSFAHPFNALSFLLVPLLSVYFLGETLPFRYYAGMVLVIAGLLLIRG